MTSGQRVVVSVQELGRTYVDRKGQGNEAIRSVSFDVRERELLCIVGPSGAGKTTLLRCLAGLLAPTTGRALFEGEEVVRSPAGIAVVFQDYSRSLFPWLSVAGNIALPLKAKRVSKRQTERARRELAERRRAARRGGTLPVAAVRRHAAARGHRAGARLRAGSAADG